MKKDILWFGAICFAAVGLAAVFGFSQEAGLFGAILGGGVYIISCIHEKRTDEI